MKNLKLLLSIFLLSIVVGCSNTEKPLYIDKNKSFVQYYAPNSDLNFQVKVNNLSSQNIGFSVEFIFTNKELIQILKRETYYIGEYTLFEPEVFVVEGKSSYIVGDTLNLSQDVNIENLKNSITVRIFSEEVIVLEETLKVVN